MIEPNEKDIGRRVIYRPSYMPDSLGDVGVVSSWNEYYVFVRYGSDVTAKATLRQDLEWEDERR